MKIFATPLCRRLRSSLLHPTRRVAKWTRPEPLHWLLATIVALLGVAPVHGGQSPSGPQDFKRLSLEELMRVDVTTVTRRPEPLGTAAAAISVITREDIRRSGVTTIANALRLADGVHVAQMNNNTWRISARGFNSTSPNKLLVMVDGRTINSSIFTTVFWGVVDDVLDDIERIEVIRGPGAALWGASAVNGVVNIITRHSRDTQGTYLSAASGNDTPGTVEGRYGARAGATTWRMSAKVADQDAQRLTTGGAAEDERRRGALGFRVDGGSIQSGEWLIKGDAFHSRDGFSGARDGESTELALEGRWSRARASIGRVDLQSYYRREYRRIPAQLSHYIDVFDVEGQQTAPTRGRHAIMWGGGLRISSDATFGSPSLTFDPAQRTYPLSSAFVQDEITLIPRRLTTTLGAKYEYNVFSGGELQPNVRARLLMPRDQVLWGAVSRAVRRPTRFDVDSITTGSTVSLVGNDDFKAETLTGSEVGYRIQPATRLSLDATGFWQNYHDLRSQDALDATGTRRVIGNSLEGRSRGVELAANLQATARWRTHVGYTWLDVNVTRASGSRDVSGGTGEADDPRHLLNVRSSLDLPRNIELDAFLRAVGELPNPRVPGYAELTLRLGWSLKPGIQLSVVGDNLLHDRHQEMAGTAPARVEIARAVRAALSARF